MLNQNDVLDNGALKPQNNIKIRRKINNNLFREKLCKWMIPN